MAVTERPVDACSAQAAITRDFDAVFRSLKVEPSELSRKSWECAEALGIDLSSGTGEKPLLVGMSKLFMQAAERWKVPRSHFEERITCLGKLYPGAQISQGIALINHDGPIPERLFVSFAWEFLGVPRPEETQREMAECSMIQTEHEMHSWNALHVGALVAIASVERDQEWTFPAEEIVRREGPEMTFSEEEVDQVGEVWDFPEMDTGSASEQLPGIPMETHPTDEAPSAPKESDEPRGEDDLNKKSVIPTAYALS